MDTIVVGPPDEGGPQDYSLVDATGWETSQQQSSQNNSSSMNNNTFLYIAVEYVKDEFKLEQAAAAAVAAMNRQDHQPPSVDNNNPCLNDNNNSNSSNSNNNNNNDNNVFITNNGDYDPRVSPLDPNMSSVARYSPVAYHHHHHHHSTNQEVEGDPSSSSSDVSRSELNPIAVIHHQHHHHQLVGAAESSKVAANNFGSVEASAASLTGGDLAESVVPVLCCSPHEIMANDDDNNNDENDRRTTVADETRFLQLVQEATEKHNNSNNNQQQQHSIIEQQHNGGNNMHIIHDNDPHHQAPSAGVELLFTDQETGISYSVVSLPPDLLVEKCLEDDDQQLLAALSPDPLLDTDNLLALDENTLKTELNDDNNPNINTNNCSIVLDNSYMPNLAAAVTHHGTNGGGNFKNNLILNLATADILNGAHHYNINGDSGHKVETRMRSKNAGIAAINSATHEIVFEEDQLLSRVYSIIDKAVPSRAKATLPESYLVINKVEDGYGIFAKKTIPKRTQFGPLKGVLKPILDLDAIKAEPNDSMLYLVEHENGTKSRLDVSDENTSNWMSFVRKATSYNEQNLVMSQEGSALYFTTTKNVLPKQELKVSYSYTYAKRHDLSFLEPLPDKSWPCFECPMAFSCSEDLQEHLNVHDEMTNEEKTLKNSKYRKRSALKNSIGCNNNNSNNNSSKKKSSVMKNNSIMSSNEEESPLKCNNCDELFVQPTAKVALRAHLIEKHMNQLISVDDNFSSVVNYKCDHCEATFNTEPLLKIHNYLHSASSSSSSSLNNDQSTTSAATNNLTMVVDGAEHNHHHQPQQHQQLQQTLLPTTTTTTDNPITMTTTCPCCQRKFPTQKQLVQHVSMMHTLLTSSDNTVDTNTNFDGLIVNHPTSDAVDRDDDVPMKFSASDVDMVSASAATPPTTISVSVMEQHQQSQPAGIIDVAAAPALTLPPTPASLAGPPAPKPPSAPAQDFKCLMCHKVFSQRDRLRRHMLVHSTDESKPLQCKTCNKRFLNNSALAGHLKTHFVGKTIFECPICKKGFEHVLKLKEHVYTHCVNNTYSCPHCTKTFEKYSIIRKHIRAFHCEQKHTCTDCTKQFPTLDKLKMHLLKHSDHREFLCADCGKQFKRKDKLKEHCKRMHSEERENDVPKSLVSPPPPAAPTPKKLQSPKQEPTDFHRFIYKCHTCFVGFKRRGMLVNHLAKRHPDIPLDSVPELNLPILQTTRDYYCQHCDKVYKSSSKRKAHILKNHPGAALPVSSRKQNNILNNHAGGGGGVTTAVGGAVRGANGTSLNGNSAGERVGCTAVASGGGTRAGLQLPDPIFSQTVGSVTTRPQNCNWCHKQYASKAKLLQHQRKKHMEELQQQQQQKSSNAVSNGSTSHTTPTPASVEIMTDCQKKSTILSDNAENISSDDAGVDGGLLMMDCQQSDVPPATESALESPQQRLTAALAKVIVPMVQPPSQPPMMLGNSTDSNNQQHQHCLSSDDFKVTDVDILNCSTLAEEYHNSGADISMANRDDMNGSQYCHIVNLEGVIIATDADDNNYIDDDKNGGCRTATDLTVANSHLYRLLSTNSNDVAEMVPPR